tara:strand:+ start:151 stop:669 length:519 start_codon:yes stop_codon:yes gene_type:complete
MSIKFFNVPFGSLFASILVLTSCLPSDDALTNDTTASNKSVAELSGSWSGRFCEQDQSEGYYQDKVTFDTLTNTAIISTNYYFDANCLILIEEIDSQTSWFTLGETITTDSGLTAREIDVFQTEDMMPPVQYSIYRIDGDVLYLGDSTDIEYTGTTEDRPTSLDFESSQTRF